MECASPLALSDTVLKNWRYRWLFQRKERRTGALVGNGCGVVSCVDFAGFEGVRGRLDELLLGSGVRGWRYNGDTGDIQA
jgi:hypothetical protein